MQAGTDGSYEDDEAEVRTFGVPDPGESDDDTGYDPNY